MPIQLPLDIFSEATLWTFHPHRLRESSVLDDLLDDEIRITIKDLSDSTVEKTCPVCTNEYKVNYANLIDGRKESDAGEIPIKLPICGHVFGHDCIQRWAPNNTCPLCREPLLYTGEVVPGYIDFDLRDCAFIGNLHLARRLMRLLREWEEIPGPPRPADFSDLATELDHHAGNFNLRPRPRVGPPAVNPGPRAQERPARSPIPDILRIIPPRHLTEADSAEDGPETRDPLPSLLERRGRRPLRVNTNIQPRDASTDSRPPLHTPSPIRRRERYIPQHLFRAPPRTRHPTSHLEYRLYTWLLAHGIPLPSPLDPHASTTNQNEELRPHQEHALFEYIQSQGAFHYPGTDACFQDPFPSSDRDVYEQLRRMGLFWQPCGAWRRVDGSIVFMSYCLAARLRGQREESERPNPEVREPALRMQLQPPVVVEDSEPTLRMEREHTDVHEPALRMQLQPPIDIEDNEPDGTRTRRVNLFRNVRDQLFRRHTPARDMEVDYRLLPRFLRLRQLRRGQLDDLGSR